MPVTPWAVLPFHKHLLEAQTRAAQAFSHMLTAAEYSTDHVGHLNRLPVSDAGVPSN